MKLRAWRTWYTRPPQLVTLRGAGVTITTTQDVAERLMKSSALGLKRTTNGR